jgi:hypothetical protein
VEKAFSESKIDLSGLPAGMYFIQIRSENKWIAERIIKE